VKSGICCDKKQKEKGKRKIGVESGICIKSICFNRKHSQKEKKYEKGKLVLRVGFV